MAPNRGRVYLVGAGPGDPGLLTLRGLECLRRAEVLVYDGLASPQLLSEIPSDCLAIYAGKKRSRRGSPLTQEAINDLLVEHASAGKRVVRLKGGDPFVFGRGSEECRVLADAGLGFEIVPGVTAAVAVPAYAGIPLTARGVSASAVLVTGHEAGNKSSGAVDWKAVAGSHTIVLFMAWKKLAMCVSELLAAGCSPITPAAAIRWGTTREQRTAVATLETLAETIDLKDVRPPMLVIIGEVVNQRDTLAWYERRPLFGKRVWLTRSSERGADMAQNLRELGADVYVAPTTEIDVATEAARAGFQASIKRHGLDEHPSYRWLFVTSVNAVHAMWRELRAMELDVRALTGVKIACVGGASRDALLAHGLRADLIAEGGGQALAKQVIALGDVGPVLFPRAEDGRYEAFELLEGAGYKVDLFGLYRSAVASKSDLGVSLCLERLRATQLESVVFFAPSQVDALIEMEPEAVGLLAHVEVIAALGETTASRLRELGLPVHACPAKPDARELFEAIVGAFTSASKS